MSEAHTPSPSGDRHLAVVTGASTGIGRAMAADLAGRGYDVLVAADEPEIHDAATAIAADGSHVSPVEVDLRTEAGCIRLHDAIRASGRVPDLVCLNAGIGVNGAFHETDLQEHLDVVALNISSVLRLSHMLLPDMVERGEGRLLITSSVTAAAPGPYISTYSASKAFVQSFAEAIRTELADTGVTVTALMPGPTDTEFFARADMLDTRLGQMNKDDPADVARDGIDAALAGKDHVVGGAAKNHLTLAGWTLLPDKVSSALNTHFTKPGTAPDHEVADT
jgi:uncharacterized protein